MPQMYNLNILCFILVLIAIINPNTLRLSHKIKGMYRIGPHNLEVLSIIYGSLLGDAHAEKRVSGLGTRITFYQESTHIKYILYLHKILSKAGYSNEKLPVITNRLGLGGKIRKICRFRT
jgi:ubiquinol-cytochrome c reductase cytochrome b subunit